MDMKHSGGDSPDIVLFTNLKDRGGGPRVFVSNIKEWVRRGYRVEIVGYRDAAPIMADEMPESVGFHHLGTRRFLPTLLALWKYVRSHRPRIIIGSSHLTNRILSYLAVLPGHSTRTWLTVHQDIVHSGKRGGRGKRRKLKEVRRLYPRATGIVTVSRGVANGLVKTVGVPAGKVHTVYNAVIDDFVQARAGEAVDHPWLSGEEAVPVVISVGRLSEQKDFTTLLRAFKQVHTARPCRLVILGEGRERPKLEALIEELELTNAVAMPGYVDNPYAWLARSRLFVLSSRWEGFGNVVAEALGVGVAVVATDCPSGPAEILADGKYGELVPVGDVEALAHAMIAVLDGGGARYDRDEASARFRAEVTAVEYLRLFGMAPENTA